MKAVILCAGLGSRTGLKYPKCLFKFDDGSTLLSKNIDNIKKMVSKMMTSFLQQVLKVH